MNIMKCVPSKVAHELNSGYIKPKNGASPYIVNYRPILLNVCILTSLPNPLIILSSKSDLANPSQTYKKPRRSWPSINRNLIKTP